MKTVRGQDPISPTEIRVIYQSCKRFGLINGALKASFLDELKALQSCKLIKTRGLERGLLDQYGNTV